MKNLPAKEMQTALLQLRRLMNQFNRTTRSQQICRYIKCHSTIEIPRPMALFIPNPMLEIFSGYLNKKFVKMACIKYEERTLPFWTIQIQTSLISFLYRHNNIKKSKAFREHNSKVKSICFGNINVIGSNPIVSKQQN